MMNHLQSLSQMDNFKLAGRDQTIQESTSIQERPARGDEHNDVLQGESDGSQPSDQQMDDTEAQGRFLKHLSSSRTTESEAPCA